MKDKFLEGIDWVFDKLIYLISPKPGSVWVERSSYYEYINNPSKFKDDLVEVIETTDFGNYVRYSHSYGGTDVLTTSAFEYYYRKLRWYRDE